MTVRAEIVVLTQDQYLRLVRKLGNTVVTDTTSTTNAAYKLGIQHTLAVLREGFVVGEVIEKPTIWQKITRWLGVN